VDFILDWRTKCAVLALFLAYLGLSIWGIARMEQGLDYEKLLISTDPLVKLLKLILKSNIIKKIIISLKLIFVT
jgi:hypothetical protein